MQKQLFKVLIVDDEPDTVEILTYNFAKAGFEVNSSPNGFHAMKLLDTWIPDVVIVDLMMPYVNGISLCNYLRGNDCFRHIPIIMLTAMNDKLKTQAAMEAGADYYVTKPADIKKLIRLATDAAGAKQDEFVF
jgi:DNA-binding response OmpR family regulator